MRPHGQLEGSDPRIHGILSTAGSSSFAQLKVSTSNPPYGVYAMGREFIPECPAGNKIAARPVF
jgi:hypothetical protein